MPVHGIPHQVQLYGKPVKIRWGNPKDLDWNPKAEHGQLTFTPMPEVTLHPDLRRKYNRDLAWSTLIHEILHLMNREEPKRKNRGWKPLSHALIHRLDGPLGRAFVEMGIAFPCICRTCKKDRAGRPA